MDHLWQRPKTIRLNYTDEIWYDTRPIGHDTLEKFMKTLIKEAELLNPKYTNHSICKTCLMSLDKARIIGRHMIYLSSHKSKSTIKEYTNKVPEKKKCQMYGILAESLDIPLPKYAKNQASSTAPNPQYQEQNVTNQNENIFDSQGSNQ